MKKISLLGIVALAISFTFCGKDYTCECTSTSASVISYYGAPQTKSTTIHATENEAKKDCEAETSTTSSVTCKIK